MKIKLAILFVLAVGALATSFPIAAHHSSSGYDMDHPVTRKGVVTSMEWTNPHVFIYMDMKDASGNVEQWRVEGNSPNMLFRAGWKKEMIKPGDTMEITAAQAKNGSKVYRLIAITLSNGQKFDGQGFR